MIFNTFKLCLPKTKRVWFGNGFVCKGNFEVNLMLNLHDKQIF